MTNNLQRKLDEVRREKSNLETQIDQEKQTNAALRSQLSDLRNSQINMAEHFETQEEMEEE